MEEVKTKMAEDKYANVDFNADATSKAFGEVYKGTSNYTAPDAKSSWNEAQAYGSNAYTSNIDKNYYVANSSNGSLMGMAAGDYARDPYGMRKLLEAIEEQINNIRKTLVGNYFMTITHDVNAYWRGPDADAFLNNLTTNVNNISTKYTKLMERIALAIEEDRKKFEAMQASNIDSIPKG